MAGPRDPFAPPPLDNDAPIELGDVPSKAWPMREDETPAPAKPLEGRKPIKYKSPNSSANVVLFSFALIGLIAIVGFGVGTLRKRGAADTVGAAGPGARPAVKAKAATAPPPKPITWKAVDKGDEVLITVEASPRAAKLLLDGAPLPSNPVRLPRGETHTLAAMADGYEPAAVDVAADAAKTVKIKLERAR